MKRMVVLLALLATPACRSSHTSDGGQGNGPGERCTVQSDCASSLCVVDPTSGLGFCSEPCHKQSDCQDDFPEGCCVPTQDAHAPVCALAALCSHGDAGLGDPCPGHDECSLGLVCLYSSDNVVSECSQPCASSDDCGGVAQECCEDLSSDPTSPEPFCVIDARCAAPPDAGPAFDAGPQGPGGDDGGPFYAALLVDGVLTADTTSFQGSVGPTSDLVDAPAQARNLELDLPRALQPGHFACFDGGGAAIPDGGTLTAIVATRTTDSSGFTGLLPAAWQNLTIPNTCGPGVVAGDPSLLVEASEIDVDVFVPGHVRTLDAGPQRGHLTGSAYWRVRQTDAGTGLLEVRERFDVELTPP